MRIVTGWIVRLATTSEAGFLYLASYNVWYSQNMEGAWVHEELPEFSGFLEAPTEYARATYTPEGGNRIIGDWTPVDHTESPAGS